MGRHISVQMRNEEIWLKFKDFVLRKHRKLHSALADEVFAALEFYLEAQGAHTQISDPPALTKKAQKESEILKRKVLEKVSPGGSLPQKMLENIVRAALLRTDRRTVNGRIENLVATGFLERDWEADFQGKVFKVIGDETSKIG